MKCIKCDRCGKLTEELGHQTYTIQLASNTWIRKNLSYIRATLSLSPVNINDDPYGGLDICKSCFGQLVQIFALDKQFKNSET